jgi:hypothetical protein
MQPLTGQRMRLLSVMFLARGNSKGRNKQGSRSKGLPGSITTRCGACLTRRREGGPRRAEFKGEINSKRGNKFDIQTTVHGREKYMLYSRLKSSL